MDEYTAMLMKRNEDLAYQVGVLKETVDILSVQKDAYRLMLIDILNEGNKEYKSWSWFLEDKCEAFEDLCDPVVMKVIKKIRGDK